MADKPVPTIDGIPLDLGPGAIIDLGDECELGFDVDIREGRHEVGQVITCTGCSKEHEIVSVLEIEIAYNVRTVRD
jgi:hypothetical protein